VAEPPEIGIIALERLFYRIKSYRAYPANHAAQYIDLMMFLLACYNVSVI
jgi:fatty-acid desaturase